MGLRRIRGTASRSPGSASGRLSPERAIIFVLRSRKLLLLVLRLRSVLHTLVGMVMRMLVYVLPLLAGRPLMFRRQCAAALRDGGNRRHLDEARETRNKEPANHDSRRSHLASPCATVAQTPSYRVRR